MPEMENSEGQTGLMDNEPQADGQNGVPLVFLREKSLFGDRKPSSGEWLKHEELYKSVGTVIDCAHITGLQRVNGLWRIYLDNLDDKVALITQGVPLRGMTIPILKTNPYRADSENTTRIRVKNIPLSADDMVISRVFVMKGIDIISVFREKLRINGKLTNCATGDRIFVVKSLTLQEPLPFFMQFGQFKGKVIHHGQVRGDKATGNQPVKCTKCLQEGHRFAQCENDWTCRTCGKPGHKAADCIPQDIPFESPVSSDTESEDSDPDDNTDDPHSATEPEGGNQEEPVQTVDKTPEAPVGETKKKKKKVKAKKNGQTTITSFVTVGDKSDATPDKGKRAPVQRSPPTPAEQLYDNSKKAKS